jgi:alanine transaminase
MGINLKAMVIINPGNPTGNVLSRDDIEDIIKICYENEILILADEVY